MHYSALQLHSVIRQWHEAAAIALRVFGGGTSSNDAVAANTEHACSMHASCTLQPPA